MIKAFLSPTKRKLIILLIFIVIVVVKHLLYVGFTYYVGDEDYIQELIRFKSVSEYIFLLFFPLSVYGVYAMENMRWIHSIANSWSAPVYFIGIVLYWYLFICVISCLIDIVVKKQKK